MFLGKVSQDNFLLSHLLFHVMSFHFILIYFILFHFISYVLFCSSLLYYVILFYFILNYIIFHHILSKSVFVSFLVFSCLFSSIFVFSDRFFHSSFHAHFPTLPLLFPLLPTYFSLTLFSLPISVSSSLLFAYFSIFIFLFTCFFLSQELHL